jgi:hypothetical protein
MDARNSGVTSSLLQSSRTPHAVPIIVNGPKQKLASTRFNTVLGNLVFLNLTGHAENEDVNQGAVLRKHVHMGAYYGPLGMRTFS